MVRYMLAYLMAAASTLLICLGKYTSLQDWNSREIKSALCPEFLGKGLQSKFH
jgi:hypothetical protein